MRKKYLRLCMFFLLVTAALFLHAPHSLYASEATGGYCGKDNLGDMIWAYDGAGTLTISGTGEMKNWDLVGNQEAPWTQLGLEDEITAVIIGEGVTSIGEDAFYSLSNLEEITIPSTVTAIRSGAFTLCTSLESITIPDSVTVIGTNVFENCTSLATVVMSENIMTIDESAFIGCTALSEVPGTMSSTGSVRFIFNRNTGVFRVYGTGEIKNFDPDENRYPYWNYLMGDIKTVVVESGVTYIGDYCFWGADQLVSVTLADSVTSIGDCAFLICGSLSSITMSDGITSLGERAFGECTSLTSFTFPSALTDMGRYVLEGCTSLTRVEIPEGITYISAGALSGCSSLTSLTIPDSVTSLSFQIIEGTAITSITIPASITYCYTAKNGLDSTEGRYYEAGPLQGAQYLTEVILEEGMQSVPANLCSQLTTLATINLPESLTAIGDGAFRDCAALTSIEIPNSVASIGTEAFMGCSSLTEFVIPSSVTSLGEEFLAYASMNSLTVPVQVTDMYRAFRYFSVQNLIFEEGTESIADYCAYGCRMVNVTIPDSVMEIGTYAFYECEQLKAVSFPSALTGIDSYAFYGCTSLTDLVIPDGVSVGQYGFHKCSAIETVVIGENCSLERYSFSNLTNLSSLTIGEGTDTGSQAPFSGSALLQTAGPIGGGYDYEFGWTEGIPAYAFANLEGLETVTLPDGVTSIGQAAFLGCTELTVLQLPDTLAEIGESAFSQCKSLTEIDLPAGVTTIGGNAFFLCSSLTKITLPEGMTTLGNAVFQQCSALVSAEIPASVVSAGYYLFDSCKALTDIYFGGCASEWELLDEGAQSMLLDGCSATVHYAKLDITDYTASLAQTEYTYDGTAHTPQVTLSGENILTEGTDYTISYENNTNAGTATVIVSGAGSYGGKISLTFTIAKAVQSITATLPVSELGIGQTAQLAVTAEGTITCISSNPSIASVSADGLVQGIAAGTATITVTAAATANYLAASVEVPVAVARAQLDASNCTITTAASSYTYRGTAITPQVTVAYTNPYTQTTVTLTQNTDYTITYTNNVNAGNGSITITGCGNYSGTVTVTFTINKATPTLRATASSTSPTYGGSTTITASVTGGGTITYTSGDTSVVTVSSDGKVTAVGAGIAVITVSVAESTNYLAVSTTISFTVSPRNLSNASVTLSQTSYTYDGKAKTPSVTVKYGTDTLTAGTDYTVSYSNNTNAGTATIQIEGKGNYTGTVTRTFLITASGSNASGSSTSESTGSGSTGSSSGSGTAGSTTTASKPSATTISSVKNTASGVKVTYKKVTGATGYYIYRSTSKNGTYKKVKTITSGSTVSWTDTGVTGGKTYYYKVYAYNSAGKASASSAKSIRYLKAGKVSSLTNASKGITIKWSKVSGASGYYVYRKAGSGSYKKIATISKATTVSYTNKTTGTYKVANGTTYTYYVIPYYKSSSGTITKGTYSATMKTVRLTAVSISSLKNSAAKTLTVKYSKNAKATGYQIQYSTSSSFASGKTKNVYVSSASTLSKKVTKLTKGKKYYVRVRAYKTVSKTKYYSAWSSKKSKTVSK